jgi:nucleobase:cation symporter-1, NCS1 family
MHIVLNAIIGPKPTFMPNTLFESANVETANLICFFIFIFIVVLLPLMMIPPERPQLPFHVAFAVITPTLVGMRIWSLAAAHGASNLAGTSTMQHGLVLSWGMLYVFQSLIGGWAGGFLGGISLLVGCRFVQPRSSDGIPHHAHNREHMC